MHLNRVARLKKKREKKKKEKRKKKRKKKEKEKFVNLVDLVKSFPTSIHLQRFVSIQPRTGLSKFAKNSPRVRKKVRTIIAEGNPSSPKSSDVV